MKIFLLETKPVKYNAAAINIRHFTIQPNYECIRRHWHDRIELLRVNEGKILVELDNNPIVLSKGEIMIIPPKALHTGYTLDEKTDYNVIMFDIRTFYNNTAICKEILPAIYDGRVVFKCVTTNKEIFKCYDDILIHGENNMLRLISKTYYLIDLYYQNELLEILPQPKNSSVKNIIDYIEANFDQDINIDILCKEFKYTAAHLCRKFKNATGLSPMVYLKIFRLETAGRKIKEGNKNISSIATECGFFDSNYFTRCFKAHFGVAPSNYLNI